MNSVWIYFEDHTMCFKIEWAWFKWCGQALLCGNDSFEVTEFFVSFGLMLLTIYQSSGEMIIPNSYCSWN